MSKADADTLMDNMELKAIAQWAYTYWETRGRPWGSPDEDWFRAEQGIKKSREWSFPSQGQERVAVLPRAAIRFTRHRLHVR